MFKKSIHLQNLKRYNREKTSVGMHTFSNRLVKFTILVFLFNVITCFLLLFRARTGLTIAIVWDAINPIFWIFFAVSIASLFYILHKKEVVSSIKMVLSCIFSSILFGMLTIIHKYMWGFDPWHHLAYIKKSYLIGGLGAGEYSPLEYMGYRGLLVSIAKLSSLSIDHLYWLHLLIIPFLASIFIPYLTFLISDLFLGEDENAWPAAISFIFFPLFMMMSIAVPNNLAIIFVLAYIYLVSRYVVYGKKIEVIPVFSTALAAFLVHQLYGSPAITTLLILIPFTMKRLRKRKIIVLCIRIMNSIYCISGDIFRLLLIPGCVFASAYTVPLYLIVRFHLYRLMYPASIARPIFTDISLNSLRDFLLPSWTLCRALQPPYLFWENFKLIRYLIIAFGGYLLLKKNKRVAVPYLLSLFSIYLAWFIVETAMINIPFSRTSHRFGMIVDTFLLPLLGVVLCKYVRVSFNNHTLRSLMIYLVVLVACISVYSGFDFDRIINRPDPLRERVITDDYIRMLNYINKTAAGKNYVIVSDIYFGKLAAGYLGLRPYYPPGTLINFNVGNQIQEYFVKIARNPFLFKALMVDIANKTYSTIGFYIIDEYWIETKHLTTPQNIDQIKHLSDEWKIFGKENKVYVFKLDISKCDIIRKLSKNTNILTQNEQNKD